MRELGLSYPVREKAEMPNALEPMRQNVEQEAAQELHGVERHRAEAVAPLIVFPAEGDLAVLQSDQAPVGDSHTMGIAGKVLQDVLGLAQGLLPDSSDT